MAFKTISVCGREEIAGFLKKQSATRVLSINSPGRITETPAGILATEHFQLAIRDTHDPADPDAPNMKQAKRILDWVRTQPDESHLLVHCTLGLSRSPAVALGLLASQSPARQAAKTLRSIRPTAMPNRLIVHRWDELLGLNDQLVRAVDTFPEPDWSWRCS